MRHFAAAAFTLLCLTVLPGCGTISRGISDEVAIEVQPANARIETSLGRSCTGSCKLRAPRNRDFTVTASAEGYATQTVEVRRRITLAGAGAVARNVAGPMVVGVGTDLYTGAAYDHVPNPVVIQLQPLGEPQVPPPEAPGSMAATAPTS